MWKSPGQCRRIGMYAEKQHLVMTDVVKSKLENDKCNKKLPDQSILSSLY